MNGHKYRDTDLQYVYSMPDNIPEHQRIFVYVRL